MNQLALTLAAAWTHLPLYRLASTPAPSTDAQNLCTGLQAGDSSADCTGATLTSHVHTITNTLLLVAGAIAVIIIIVGGIRYVVSQGDATGVKQAKDTILYAIVGLAVVILAFAIVSFVSGSV